jgi:hypothetical protein
MKGDGEEKNEVCEPQVNKTLFCRDLIQLLWRRVLFSGVAKGWKI